MIEQVDRPRGSAAWIAWIAVGIGQTTALWLMLTQNRDAEAFSAGDLLTVTLAPVTYATFALLILRKQPRHLVGRLFMAVAGAFSSGFLAQEWAVRALITDPGSLPFGRFAASLAEGAANLLTVLLTLLVLVFPTGRPLSPRWRWVAAGGIASVTAALLLLFASDAATTAPFRQNLEFPSAGLGLFHDPDGSAAWIAGLPASFFALSSIVSMLIRWRRSRGTERQQIKVVAFVLATGLGLLLLSGFSPPLPKDFNTVAGAIIVLGFPAAGAVAVLRYRLYDIDLVISKALVYALLATFVTAVYIGVVVGLGTTIGSRDNIALSIVATAAIAFLFQPVKDRVQRFANRLVFGERSTPYETLTRFSERMAASREDVLPQLAGVVAESMQSASATVWVRDGEDTWRRAATFPAEAEPPEDARADIRHRGELLGAITVSLKPGETLRPTDQQLLEGLAGQAGVVLHNQALSEELRSRIEQIHGSRARLARAQVEERRRLEDVLRVGPEKTLRLVEERLGAAARDAAADPAAGLLEEIGAETGVALEELRAFARGMYPAMLASQGLAGAVRSVAARASVPVAVSVEATRYEPDVEAAVYFCVLEALQNIDKYAAASNAQVHIAATGDGLRFTVTDDGAGFDVATVRKGAGTSNMHDRLAAFDGRLRIESTPGHGTRVEGTVRARALETA